MVRFSRRLRLAWLIANLLLLVMACSPAEPAANPGGMHYYQAFSLQMAGKPVEAAALYREELATANPAWQALAFKGWLACLQAAGDWQAIIAESPAISEKVIALLGEAGRNQAGNWLEIQDIRETWQQTMIEACLQGKQINQAFALVKSASSYYNADTMPDWIYLAQARLGLDQAAENAKSRLDGLIDYFLPVLFSVDAHEAGAVAQTMLLAPIAPPIAPQAGTPSAITEALSILIAAKANLARGQAETALAELRSFLDPVGKATKAQLASAKRLRNGLTALLGRYPGLPDAFFRDFYNAGRLAGRLTESAAIMDQVRLQIVAPDRRLQASAIVPNLLEYKGRLLRAKGDHPAARAEFSQALRWALNLEKSGAYNALDRRRIQWYLLKSLTDAESEPGSVTGFDLPAFLDQASRTDDAAYFDDVLEQAVLLTGRQQHWHDFELLYRKLSPVMLPELRSRCALVLARVSQLRIKENQAEQGRFDRFSIEARDLSDSLYYRALAGWLRGEALDLADLLQPRIGIADIREPESEQAITLSWVTQVVRGYCQLQLFDAGMDYLWDRRRDISLSQLTDLGNLYIDAGRYRQGLRLLESVRVRGGHPTSRELLSHFYPRPFLDSIHAAADGSMVSEWLLLALVRTESNFDTSANSGAGAKGLAQLMPATAKLVAKDLKITAVDLADPATNLRLGAVYLRNQYNSSGLWPQSLAAYNAGMGRVRGWVRNGLNPDPLLFAELIPVDESRNYVHRIVESSLLYNWLYYGLEPAAVLTLLFKSP